MEHQPAVPDCPGVVSGTTRLVISPSNIPPANVGTNVSDELGYL
jgi:hypothetical protein